MSTRAKLSVFEMRSATRHPVAYTAAGQHRDMGELTLELVNISAHGFMVRGGPSLERGERIQVRLPHIGLIEGHMVWSHEDRAGFQFERLIRSEDFGKLLAHLQTKPRVHANPTSPLAHSTRCS